MAPASNMVGERFGRLTVVGRATNDSGGKTRWNCICDCGGHAAAQRSNLRSGRSTSCGCAKAELMAERNRRDAPHGLTNTPVYLSWKAMIARCERPSSPNYQNYGGRGIVVCARWRNSFPAFLEDMGQRPEGRTLDRWPNNDGNYEPGNCRWATPKEQSANRRNSRRAYPHGDVGTRALSVVEEEVGPPNLDLFDEARP